MQNIIPKVFIVDDEEAIRDSLCMLMKSVGFKHEAYHNAQQFLDNYDVENPGCLLLDIRMPGISGLELQTKMKEMSLDLPIIFITGHGDVTMAVEAMKKGAVDFFQKPFRDQELLDRIDQIFEKTQCKQHERVEHQQALSRLETLTTREHEVMTLVIAGSGNKKIAAELGISQRTVEIHRAHVMQKMHAHSVAQLVKMCFILEHCKQCQRPSNCTD